MSAPGESITEWVEEWRLPCPVCRERVAAGLPHCECAYCAMGARCPWGHDYPRSCPSAMELVDKGNSDASA